MKHNISSHGFGFDLKKLFGATSVRLFALIFFLASLNACLEATRLLKRSVNYMGIESPPITLPNDQSFDLDGILNLQIHEVVDEGGQYVIYNRLAESAIGRTFNIGTKVQTLTAEDVALLAKYGFANPFSTAGNQLVAPLEDSVSCLLHRPQIQLKGQVRAFELTDKAGLKIGFSDIFAGAIANVGLKFQISSARFELGIQAYDTLTGIEVGAAVGVARQSSVDFLLDLERLPLEVNYFHKTPLAKITSRGLDRALSRLWKVLEKKSSTGKAIYPWESRVIAFSNNPDGNSNSRRVLILGGSEDGMEQGDSFNATNLHYYWEREPCVSSLRDRIPETSTPQAELAVIETGLRYSVANLTSLSERAIRIGAQVKLKAFKEVEKKR